jgi:hypothetical protein
LGPQINFLKVYKIKSVLSLHGLVVLKLLVCLVEQKIKCMKSLLASIKTLANSYWQIYSNHHFSLDEEKICLNLPVHVTGGLRNNFQDQQDQDQVLRLQAACCKPQQSL